MFEVSDDAIDLARLVRAVADPRAGAVVTFLGATRNENDGRRVVRLEYEAFTAMAVREMRALGREAARRWPLRKVAVAHRVGVVPVGEASVGIAVSAAHRAEAFAACHWLIDRLKETVPRSRGRRRAPGSAAGGCRRVSGSWPRASTGGAASPSDRPRPAQRDVMGGMASAIREQVARRDLTRHAWVRIRSGRPRDASARARTERLSCSA